MGERAYAAMAEIIGADAMKLLVKHFGGSRAYIPRCDKQQLAKRNRGIVAAYNDGASVAQLVRQHILSDRQIRNILKDTDMSESATIDCPQQNLF